MQDVGVGHRVSSAHHPHSNLWAEVAVRTIKGFAADCTGLGGTVDMDAFASAMLQYRNTPCIFLAVSPAQRGSSFW